MLRRRRLADNFPSPHRLDRRAPRLKIVDNDHQMTEQDLESVTAQDRLTAVFRPNAVVVVVAPRDDLFELGRKWERKVQDLGWSTHVARERIEALGWLREHFPPPPPGKLEADIDTARAPGAEQ